MQNDNIQNLREALKFSPNNVPLKLMLAESLVQAGTIDEALTEFKEILAIDRTNSKAKFGLAQCYFHKSDYPTASIILEEIAPNSSIKEVLVLYARVLIRENRISEAIDIHRNILTLDPYFFDDELDSKLKVMSLPSNGDFDMNDLIDEESLKFLETPNVSFEDVGGMDRVKEEIDLKIIRPLKHADLYAAYGKKIGGGILLYGPPGCGKTHIARATAGQVDARFISVGINDILDMYIGNSEKNLHEIFELARRNKPCVLFFDEVDALGASRYDMRNSSGRQLINQFLAEMDGIDSNNDGVLIIGATNAPWQLDGAFRRPGRFDRIIFVDPPDAPARAQILQIILKGKPAEQLDLNAVAKATADFSGADLKAVVDIAIEEKLKEAFKSGIPAPLSTKDLVSAAKKHRPSTKEWFNSARNYALYSNESGLYDDVLTYLNIKK
ncbi:tetratricopeptide repeat protein [Solitalea sp. MAHUQ-68]|uniref:Tetratricopeptide repeat protein n=1 Tax=Solitalea agri TaxID=2953739 RepID=A0A9X2JE76_9SPHI|nr:tetratricopeptide repeat protein [Solitalea agri]MCO4294444.1 tetratricopeptide repeat protein [Solitalea agri]